MKNFTLICLSLLLTLSGFSQTSRIITDFRGYWSSTTGSPNPLPPDTSHMLLGFTFNGVTYSTGVNDGVLISNGVSYTPGNWRAFPVAGITGNYGSGDGGGINCYVALAKKVDKSPNTANIPVVSAYSIRAALIDGVNGLDLGTGVTNLPASAIMNFSIFNIDPAKINDDEPDILLTQIAQPTASNDVFSLVDAMGNQVGTSFTQNMNSLSSFGEYALDLYNLTPNTPYNAGTVYSTFGTNESRPIRVVGVKLSSFGITPANVGQVAALKITPSGTSDYAFIAYNANSINLTPNISQNPPLTNTTVCENGTAHLSVIATPAQGGTLTYSWEESTDGGNTWHNVTEGGNYAGATTSRLAVTDPDNGSLYRATVAEEGNPNSAIGQVFQVTVTPSPTAPASVTIAGGGTICSGTPVQLTSNVSGGTNLFYEWQVDPANSGTFVPIPNANLTTYVPPAGQTGTVSYRVRVSSGSACIPERFSNTQVVTINGISSTAADEICGPGTVNLSAAANTGTVNWYTSDQGGTTVTTGGSYSPNLSNTTIYYVASSACPSTSLRVPITAAISPAAAGGTLNGSTSVPPGSNTTTLTLSGNTGSIVKWQSSTDDFVSNIVDIPNTSNQLTVTNLTQTTSYRAQVASGSCAPQFSTLATITTGTLPIRIGSVKAIRENNGIRVEWMAYNQQNTVGFDIERSTDGISFSKVQTIASNGSQTDSKYQWLDAAPAQGKNYYRIKEVYRSGNSEYSTIVSAAFENNKAVISVYPNPVKDRNLTIEFRSLNAGKYQVSYTNNFGQVVHQEIVTHSGGNHKYTLTVPATISRGLYTLVITSADKATRVSSGGVIIQ